MGICLMAGLRWMIGGATSTAASQGRVTWFVRVIDVGVKPVDNDEFSQISSGRLTVTGLLGVIRIKTDRDETPVPDTRIISLFMLIEICPSRGTPGSQAHV